MVEVSFQIVQDCSKLVDGGMESPKVLLQECVQFLKVIHQYLCGEDPYNASEVVKCDDSKGHPQPSELGDRIYLNLLPDDSREVTRATLKAQCEGLLGRIEKTVRLGSALNVAPKCPPDQHQEEEEEGAYLDMSGSNTPKATIGSSSASIDDTTEDVEAAQDSIDGPNSLEPQENTYELTTDQILYDECQQDETCGEVSPTLKTAESVTDEHQCPFSGLPASHLRLQQSPKHGTLFKQEKRLFFDQFKKYYVGLIGKWLLVYNSHNDLKPCQTIFIKSFKLDLSLNEHINEKHLFQIYTHTDSKVHFLSPSFQDLNEWIVAIENNLIERTDRVEGTGSNAIRKLPLPPYPEQCGIDETDLHTMSHDDGIYEEPALCLKTEVVSPAKENGGSANTHGYDTPKPGTPKPVEPDVVPDGGKTDSPPSMGKKNETPVTSSDFCAVNPAIPQLTTSSNRPVKSWLKNRFNRSPAEPVDVKPSKKAMKKLSFEELPASDGVKEPKGVKGAKINMIISQLEANGKLNLLSKRLNESNKRYTWVVDDVAG